MLWGKDHLAICIKAVLLKHYLTLLSQPGNYHDEIDLKK